LDRINRIIKMIFRGRSSIQEQHTGAAYRSRSQEQVSGAGLRSRSQEQVSGAGLRSRFQEQVSGAGKTFPAAMPHLLLHAAPAPVVAILPLPSYDLFTCLPNSLRPIMRGLNVSF
jgi:hypothetical protein